MSLNIQTTNKGHKCIVWYPAFFQSMALSVKCIVLEEACLEVKRDWPAPYNGSSQNWTVTKNYITPRTTIWYLCLV